MLSPSLSLSLFSVFLSVFHTHAYTIHRYTNLHTYIYTDIYTIHIYIYTIKWISSHKRSHAKPTSYYNPLTLMLDLLPSSCCSWVNLSLIVHSTICRTYLDMLYVCVCVCTCSCINEWIATLFSALRMKKIFKI